MLLLAPEALRCFFQPRGLGVLLGGHKAVYLCVWADCMGGTLEKRGVRMLTLRGKGRCQGQKNYYLKESLKDVLGSREGLGGSYLKLSFDLQNV